MRYLIPFVTFLLMILTPDTLAGLPPTTSKLSSDSNNVTTFNYQFPNFTGTHSGVTVSLGVNSVAGGGTGSSSFSAPSGTINPIIYYNGTSLTNDSTITDLGYDATNDIFYSAKIIIAGSSTQTAKFTNTGAQSSTAGAGMQGFADPGAAITSGSRLGFYTLGGAQDSSHTTTNSVAISAFASQNWSSGNTGADLRFEVTPNNSSTRAAAMTLSNAGYLGLGTTAPTTTLTLASGSTITNFNTSDQTTNYQRLRQYWSGNAYIIATENGGTANLGYLQLGAASIANSTIARTFTIYNSISTVAGAGIFDFSANTSAAASQLTFNLGSAASSGIQNSLSIQGTVNQSSTAGFNALIIQPYVQAQGSGGTYLINAGTNTSSGAGGTFNSKFSVDINGNPSVYYTASQQGLSIYGTSDNTNYQRLNIFSNGSNMYISSTYAGTQTNPQNIVIGAATSTGLTPGRLFTIAASGSTSQGFYDFSNSSTSGNGATLTIQGSHTSSSSLQTSVGIFPTINQSGTASTNILYLSPYFQATGSGSQFILNVGSNSAAQNGGTHTPYFTVNNGGQAYISNRLGIGSTGITSELQVSGSNSTSALFNTTLGLGFAISAGTLTSTGSSGTIALMGANTIGIPTLASGSTTTLTKAATLYIDGAPTVGTNVSIGSAYSLYINSGNTYTGGTIYSTSRIQSNYTSNFVSLLGIGNPAYSVSANYGTLGFGLGIQSKTITSTISSGTIAIGASNSIAGDTMSASSSTTLTSAATLYIDAAPIGGTNVSIGTAYALYVNAGQTYLGGALSLGTSLSPAYGGTGLASPTTGNLLLTAGSSNMTLLAPGNAGYVVTDTGTTFAVQNNPAAPVQSYELYNTSIASSVSSNALTVNLNQSNGSTATSGSPSIIAFRNSTAGTGTVTTVQVTGSLSLTIPSSTTIGTVSGVSSNIYVYAVNNAGTVVLGVSLKPDFDEGALQNTSAISGGTSTTTLYTSSALSGVAVRLIGKLVVSETTAGTWASNASVVSNFPFSNGNITSLSQYPMRIESVTFGGSSVDNITSYCSSTPCTIWHQTGSISSITRVGTGEYSVSFVSGTFSAAPMCTMTAWNGQGLAVAQVDTSMPTSSTVTIQVYNTGSTKEDSILTLNCEGPR